MKALTSIKNLTSLVPKFYLGTPWEAKFHFASVAGKERLRSGTSRASVFPSRTWEQEGTGRKAFTLIEILAAMVFIAILLPVIFEGVTLASRASAHSEREAIALELAQNKMAELVLDDAWTSADPSGDFGDDWPGYRWEWTQESWDADTMTVLAVETFFNVQGKEQSVTLSTLVRSNP